MFFTKTRFLVTLLLLAGLTATVLRASTAIPNLVGLTVEGDGEVRSSAIVLGLDRNLGQPCTDGLILDMMSRLMVEQPRYSFEVDVKDVPAGRWITYKAYRSSPSAEGGTLGGFKVVGGKAAQEAFEALGLRRYVGQPITNEIVDRGLEVLKALGTTQAIRADIEPGARVGEVLVKYTVVENPRIESIQFEGNASFPAEELLSHLDLRVGQVLDYTQLYGEVNRIADLYLEEKGLLYAGVVNPAQVEVEGGKVTIHVTEYRLRRVDVQGVGGSTRRAVLASLPLKHGEVIHRPDLMGGLFSISRLPQVEDLQYSARFDDDRGEVTLRLDLTRGRQAASWPLPGGAPAGRGELD